MLCIYCYCRPLCVFILCSLVWSSCNNSCGCGRGRCAWWSNGMQYAVDRLPSHHGWFEGGIYWWVARRARSRYFSFPPDPHPAPRTRTRTRTPNFWLARPTVFYCRIREYSHFSQNFVLSFSSLFDSALSCSHNHICPLNLSFAHLICRLPTKILERTYSATEINHICSIFTIIPLI